MSKPRYDWWPYAKGMIRRYPQLAREYAALKEQSITAGASGMPGGSDISNPTERCALRELPRVRQREYDAVRRAIEETQRYKAGAERLKVIKMVLWDRSHTLAGAALCIPCHEQTAKQWHRDFVRLVARYYGLVDDIPQSQKNVII